MFVTSPRDFFTGHFGSAGTIRSVFLACGTISFLDTAGFRSTFIEKLFFLLVDNKVSCQDLGFCSLFNSSPFKGQRFLLRFYKQQIILEKLYSRPSLYLCVYHKLLTIYKNRLFFLIVFLKEMDKLGELQFSHLYENCKTTSEQVFSVSGSNGVTISVPFLHCFPEQS